MPRKVAPAVVGEERGAIVKARESAEEGVSYLDRPRPEVPNIEIP